MSSSIIETGLQGIKLGQNDAAEQAKKLSQALTPEGDGDVVSPAVALKLDQVQVAASAQIVKIGSELDQDVLNILA